MEEIGTFTLRIDKEKYINMKLKMNENEIKKLSQN